MGHVHGVPAHCIRGTCVDGLTVAAAAGSLDVIRRYFTRYSQEYIYNDPGIMRVNPFLIAILKNRTECVEMIIAKEIHILSFEGSVIFIESTFRRKRNSKTAILKEAKGLLKRVLKMELPVFFQRHESYKVYNDEDHVYDVARCLAITFRTKNVKLEVEVTNYILSSIRKLTRPLPLKLFSLVAIMFDRPTFVRSLVLGNVHVFDRDRLGEFDVLLEELAEVCVVLERKDCLSVFREFPRNISPEISPIRRAELLISLLHVFYDDFSCEIAPRLASSLNGVKISDLSGLINLKEPPHFLSSALLDKRVLKLLTQYGVDLDFENSRLSTTLLTQVLTCSVSWAQPRHYRNIRAAVEFLISENPSIELNTTALQLALKADQTCHTSYFFQWKIYGELVMDAMPHAMSSNHDPDSALNFFGPLLIESGFPLTKGTLSRIQLLDLHIEVRKYISEYTEQPRSLMMICRNVLRRYYAGHKLHVFVDKVRIQGKIRDYIMLKDILKCDDYYFCLAT